MDSLRGYLAKKAGALGGKQIAAAGVVSAWNKVAPGVLPDKMFKASQAVSFKQDCLKIGVTDPAMANLIVLYQLPLMEAVNKELGSEAVKRISFKTVASF
jgi:hypothetical protein